MKYTTSLLLALYCLFYTSCNRKKSNTDTAYFSCYINGQYWEPEKQKGLGEYPITAKLLYDETNLRISADKGLQRISVWIYDSTIVKTTHYQLTKTPYTPQAIYDNNLSVDDYRTDSIYTGFATIVLIDKNKMTVQGTFYFDAYNSVKKDTVHITNGKFKLKYTLH